MASEGYKFDKKRKKNWDKNKVTVELKIFVGTYGKWYLNLWGKGGMLYS